MILEKGHADLGNGIYGIPRARGIMPHFFLIALTTLPGAPCRPGNPGGPLAP